MPRFVTASILLTPAATPFSDMILNVPTCAVFSGCGTPQSSMLYPLHIDHTHFVAVVFFHRTAIVHMPFASSMLVSTDTMSMAGKFFIIGLFLQPDRFPLLVSLPKNA